MIFFHYIQRHPTADDIDIFFIQQFSYIYQDDDVDLYKTPIYIYIYMCVCVCVYIGALGWQH